MTTHQLLAHLHRSAASESPQEVGWPRPSLVCTLKLLQGLKIVIGIFLSLALQSAQPHLDCLFSFHLAFLPNPIPLAYRLLSAIDPALALPFANCTLLISLYERPESVSSLSGLNSSSSHSVISGASFWIASGKHLACLPACRLAPSDMPPYPHFYLIDCSPPVRPNRDMPWQQPFVCQPPQLHAASIGRDRI
ncbi:hypothetical protein BKA81DRAFT_39295 [Phyllosticta paracitricarpa]